MYDKGQCLDIMVSGKNKKGAYSLLSEKWSEVAEKGEGGGEASRRECPPLSPKPGEYPCQGCAIHRLSRIRAKYGCHIARLWAFAYRKGDWVKAKKIAIEIADATAEEANKEDL